ncbi:5,6-dimethylbenzimidazole synthase [Kribbella sp. NPDC026611]|uniref:5,6-dimethylbenzimidazole synthase n=1 Tax=Kribbella sp. NPDC026611 TaxID=3154911 RepID=UPI0033F95339
MRLVLGIGLRSGTPYDELRELIDRAIKGIDGEITLVATLDGREHEPALKQLGVDICTFKATDLAEQPTPTPSTRVDELTGTPSVAEAAVLAAGAQLIVQKQRSTNATVAVGRLPAPGYDANDREVVHRVIAERRDVRRGFLDVPVPADLLTRVLEAAHRAPSVGLSQPWDFLVIRDHATRRKIHDLATAQRDAFAASLPDDRRAAFDGLKIEAILDTPVNIAVTCDPGRGGRHVLGRHADPRTTWFSAAIAIQNLWLAARAEGLGVGWVSFFEPSEVQAVLDLPPHIELVGYLCVGYVDEFAAAPELVRTGWAKRRPLTWAIHHEEWGRRDASIVDDAVQAGAAAVTTGQTLRLVVGGDRAALEQPDVLLIDLGTDRPAKDFGILWRPARTTEEAVEFGVEIARDLGLQGVAHLVVEVSDRSERAAALARGVALGARACGLTHSSA